MGWKLRVYDAAVAPLVALAAWPMKAARFTPMHGMPATRSVLKRLGVFPIVDHYYEPSFLANDGPAEPRDLPGIDFALDAQLRLIESWQPHPALAAMPRRDDGSGGFFLDNLNFEAGDAELWFHMIRHARPTRIVEIGSGHSTRLARLAIDSILAEDPAYRCDHLCIEPFEMPWLESTGARVLRQRVEEVGMAPFEALGANDILFIDSSHIIRPGGDVLVEFLEILPRLAPGVIVHIHDIFSPRHYPASWTLHPRFWNEQYLLEAFLSHNMSWEVMLAANLMKHEHYDALARLCPHLEPAREPGSFYIRRTG